MNRSAWVLLGTIAAVTTLEASKKRTVCTIRGEIHPVMALRTVWLIQNGDTIAARRMGSRFQVDVKPGRYAVWIDAIAPYQDQTVGNIDLGVNNTRDIGEIQLFQ